MNSHNSNTFKYYDKYLQYYEKICKYHTYDADFKTELLRDYEEMMSIVKVTDDISLCVLGNMYRKNLLQAIKVDQKDLGLVFPSTEISVNETLNFEKILSEYAYSWSSISDEIPTVLGLKEKSEALKGGRESYLFSSRVFVETLIAAAAENLKSNEGRIIQRISNVDQVIIVGDIHGDLPSLLMILNKYTKILKDYPKTCLVFLGDYVDRGVANLEVVYILAFLKSKYPNRIYLCRGNHECSNSFIHYENRPNGNMFYNLLWRTDNINGTYLAYVIFICSLSYVATINNLRTVCVHGGMLKHELPLNERIKFLPTIKAEDSAFSLLWSDYPNVEREREFCQDSISKPAEMDKFMQKENFDIFVKGHSHCSANNQIHTKTRHLYTLISSIYALNSAFETIMGKDSYIEQDENTVTFYRQCAPNHSQIKSLVKSSATILFINKLTQNSIEVLEGEDINYIYADVMGFFKEHYGFILPISKFMMDDLQLPIDYTTPPHESCTIVSKLCRMLGVTA